MVQRDAGAPATLVRHPVDVIVWTAVNRHATDVDTEAWTTDVLTG
jgi:hypothetical protein